MNLRQMTVATSVAVIVLVTLASGPLVGAVDFTTEVDRGPSGDTGEGSADVTVLSLPDSATISEGRYGSQKSYLRVPDATVDLQNVTGEPLVQYELDIPEMGYSTATTAFLSPGMSGQQTLEITRVAFEPGEITRSQYNATLSIALRANGNKTVIQSRAIVIEVEP